MSNRRKFFKHVFRLMMLSGLVGGSAWLVTRNGITNSCGESELCSSCSRLKSCGLEKAKKYRGVSPSAKT